MTSLLDWAERQFRQVEQDGAVVATIKLITGHDGEVWETWTAPFGEPTDWITGVEGYLRSLENEWPNRAVNVLFVALSAQGEVLSRFPKQVTGRNKATAGGPWNSDQAAASMAMDNVALTMEKLQRLVNTQLDASRRIAESNAVTIFQQNELIKLLKHNAAVAESEVEQDVLTKMLSEHGSDFLELAKLALSAASDKRPRVLKTVNEIAKGKTN